jgi:hypothetical protein
VWARRRLFGGLCWAALVLAQSFLDLHGPQQLLCGVEEFDMHSAVSVGPPGNL